MFRKAQKGVVCHIRSKDNIFNLPLFTTLMYFFFSLYENQHINFLSKLKTLILLQILKAILIGEKSAPSNHMQ